MPTKKALPFNFYHNLPPPIPTRRVINRFFDGKEKREKKAETRLRIAEERGFYPTCEIRWRQRPSVVCILKKVSKDGFLLLINSPNRENPANWDLVE